jgi:hypothetical protein
MHKEHTVKKSSISIFFRDEKIRVGMEWPVCLIVCRFTSLSKGSNDKLHNINKHLKWKFDEFHKTIEEQWRTKTDQRLH